MTQRIVVDELARKTLVKFIEGHALPFTISIASSGIRSLAQNRLLHLWFKEIAEQLPGTFESPDQVRGYCKLHVGVPILREVDEEFRAAYDQTIKPLSYEQKLACMLVPIEMPVTSRMSVKQLTRYLDEVHREFTQRGVELTIPEDKRLGWAPMQNEVAA